MELSSNFSHLHFTTFVTRKQIIKAIFETAGYTDNWYLKARLKGSHLQQLLLNSDLHPRIHHVPASEENVLNQQLLNILWVPGDKTIPLL